jgi:hypothetical protein
VRSRARRARRRPRSSRERSPVRRSRLDGMGGGMAFQRGRVLHVLLQHDPDAGRRHA